MFIKLLVFYIAYSYLVHLWAKQKVNLIQQPNTKQHSLFYEQWKPYFNKTQENIDELIDDAEGSDLKKKGLFGRGQGQSSERNALKSQ